MRSTIRRALGVALAVAGGAAGCRGTARPPGTARVSVSPSASAPSSARASASAAASTKGPSTIWTAAAKQPTTEKELHAFTGHWQVTGSDLKLHAYRDGIALMFEVEADTPAYRKGEIRFELEMALNGTGFSVRDHGRPDPGPRTYDAWGLSHCLRVTRIVGEPTMGSYDYLAAKVVDDDTLRVHRVVWTATFETGAGGRIVDCVGDEATDDPWDELRRIP